MKNIVIRSGSLRMGGLERVLIEMLQNLNTQKYNVSLIIEDNSGSEMVFLNEVPKDIDIYFLKPKSMIDKTHYHRERKKNLYHKIMYNYLMSKEHSHVVTKTQNVLKKISEKYGSVDVFLDYDWGSRRYVEKLEAKKKIVWIHNSIPKLLKKESKIVRFGKNLAKYDLVVAICDDMKKEIEEIYPHLKGKVKRVYNPFNFNRIQSLANDLSGLNEIQKELIKDNYILTVSRLDILQKDYETLIRGYELAVKNGLEEKLYIVGDGSDRDKIEVMIENSIVKEKIFLIGQTKNPYVWMKNSKLFVHSSKYEGFGLVLVEAMILGKVVISSDCKVGPKEILQNNESGLLFEVGDFEELSKKLLEIQKDKKKQEILEKKSLMRAQDFSADVIRGEIEKVIL